jgi:hypothetical protein
MDRASARHGGRRRPAVRRIVHGVLLVALTVGGLRPAAASGRAGRRRRRPAPGQAFLIVAVLASMLAVGARPAIVGRAGGWAASAVRHVRSSIDLAKVFQTCTWLAALARTALIGRDFAVSLTFAAGNWLFDLRALGLVFLALRYQPGFGPLTVAHGAANIASAISLTPGGLGSSRPRCWPSRLVSVRHGPPRCWLSSATGSWSTGSCSSPVPSRTSGSGSTAMQTAGQHPRPPSPESRPASHGALCVQGEVPR